MSVLRGPARRAADTIGLYFGLALLGLMLLVGTAICLLAAPLLARERHRRFVRRATAWVFRNFLRVLGFFGLVQAELDALDQLANERSLVIASNHPSLIDAVLVLSRLPNAVCIMKSELATNPFLGAGASMAGYIRNDSIWSMVRRAVESLHAGEQVLIFPEGTRTVTRPVNPLKGSFALIANRAQVPVQVVIIETDSPYLAKGWPLWRKPAFPLRYRARLGPRIAPAASAAELVGSVTTAYFEAMSVRGPRARATASADEVPLDA